MQIFNELRFPASLKNTISALPLYLRTEHVLEVGTFNFMLEAHLHSLTSGN